MAVKGEYQYPALKTFQILHASLCPGHLHDAGLFHIVRRKLVFSLSKIKNLEAEVKSATTKLAQTERQLCQAASSKRDHRSIQSPGTPQGGNQSDSSTPEVEKDQQGDQITPDASSEAWNKFEMLRAEHHVLVEDLEQAPVAGGGDPLRERSLLQASCWQLLNDQSDADTDQDQVISLELEAQELAAVAVAVDLTSSSGLAQELVGTFGCEVSVASIDTCKPVLVRGGLYLWLGYHTLVFTWSFP